MILFALLMLLSLAAALVEHVRDLGAIRSAIYVPLYLLALIIAGFRTAGPDFEMYREVFESSIFLLEEWDGGSIYVDHWEIGFIALSGGFRWLGFSFQEFVVIVTAASLGVGFWAGARVRFSCSFVFAFLAIFFALKFCAQLRNSIAIALFLFMYEVERGRERSPRNAALGSAPMILASLFHASVLPVAVLGALGPQLRWSGARAAWIGGLGVIFVAAIAYMGPIYSPKVASYLEKAVLEPISLTFLVRVSCLGLLGVLFWQSRYLWGPQQWTWFASLSVAVFCGLALYNAPTLGSRLFDNFAVFVPYMVSFMVDRCQYFRCGSLSRGTWLGVIYATIFICFLASLRLGAFGGVRHQVF